MFTESIGLGSPKSPWPREFDFGPPQSVVKPGAHLVTEKTLYQSRTGFGLLAPAEGAFVASDAGLKDEMTIDGVRSNQTITFRVDLPAGSYWIELFMAGGRRSQWHGGIRANHSLLADSLFQYGISHEGEEPPLYWSFLRKATVADKGLVLSLVAQGQETTLTGISIYPDELGPLQLRDGVIVASDSFDVPNGDLAVRLLNKGSPAEVLRIIDQIPEERYGYEKALLLLALAGRLETEAPRTFVDLAEKLLEKEYARRPDPAVALNLSLAKLYVRSDMYFKMGGWDWANVYTGEGIFTRLNLAGQNLEKIHTVANHPLNHRAAFDLGKLLFHAWVEQHDHRQKQRSDLLLRSLLPYYANLRQLRIYLGERLPPESMTATMESPEAPQWATQTYRALTGLREVIHYWVDFRQAEDGQFGGKYDDDVEMLRWWPIARLAWNDAKALLGMRRLVDGVWSSGWISNGFSAKVRDVEHSSEPVADTQPMMIGLDYGNPIYVERCMQSIKGLRDVWTGINAKGHRHFKSSWYSHDQIDTRPPRDCDVEMNARTVKAARWLAWYNKHPFAMQFIREWSDAWLEDCLRTDKGKPYGIVPSAISFNDDAIGGHADNWHHPEMFWSYYDFQGGTQMLQQFLATYLLWGEQKYLEPIEAALQLVSQYDSQDIAKAHVGSEAWVAGILRRSSSFAETVELWRLLTHNTAYDDLIAQLGSDCLKFRLTGDKKHLANGSAKVFDGTLYNRELITTEGYFTDRIEIGNVNEREECGPDHLESMFTGHALQEGFYPFYAVSWSGMDGDFVAAVATSTPQKVEILTYNFAEAVKQGSVNFWTLAAGEYEFLQGPDANDDGVMDAIVTRDRFSVTGRSASHPVNLPPQSLQIMQVRQLAAAPQKANFALADLAITEREVQVEKSHDGETLQIRIPVHNIGIVEAVDFTVALVSNQSDKNLALSQKHIPKLAAPLDLEAKVVVVEFSVKASAKAQGALSIQIDPDDLIPEITESNNQITIEL